MAPNCKSSDACDPELPERSPTGLCLSGKVDVLRLRKENASYAEGALVGMNVLSVESGSICGR